MADDMACLCVAHVDRMTSTVFFGICSVHQHVEARLEIQEAHGTLDEG